MASNVFTVAPGAPFLDTVARAVLSGDLPKFSGTAPKQIDLPNVSILLPTPRATRAMQDAFLRVSGTQALLLPRIQSIAESDEDRDLLFNILHRPAQGTAPPPLLPPAIDDVERIIVLTQLILRWTEAKAGAKTVADAGFLADDAALPANTTPAQAAALARDLAQLMDMIEREGGTLDDLDNLVPEALAHHWQDTVAFLKIITEAWPAYLQERQLMAKAERRNQVILAEVQRLKVSAPHAPVIIAGVTGSIPATAKLIEAVAHLDNGAIVLPALDQALDDESWEIITGHREGGHTEPGGHPEHPQFGLKQLLDTLGIARNQVQTVGQQSATKVHAHRQALISEAMRPASTTKKWQQHADKIKSWSLEDALADVQLMTAHNAQDEAEAIALIMRQALETPGRTAALVSPDRLLARRVGVRLESWGIQVDDSAGRPFAKTPPGTFLDLVISAVASDFSPADVVALLKHPLTRLGWDPFTIRKTARALEIAAFRTAYLGRGLDGIREALHRAELDTDDLRYRHRAVRRIHTEDWTNAHVLIDRLEQASAPLLELFANQSPQALSEFTIAHLQSAEAIARHEQEDGTAEAAHETASQADEKQEVDTSPLWRGTGGDAGSQFFARMLASDGLSLQLAAIDYPDLYRSFLTGLNVREDRPVHPRLSIWGLFESRLQQPDVVILGSLNDSTWPRQTDPGPWLNRSMRAVMGLPSPEEDIGREAHDFTSLLSADTVYLTRSEKTDSGDPTVPSRWLLRFEALLNGLDAGDLLVSSQPWMAWARARDVAKQEIAAVPAPEPRPGVELRPRKLSVSDVERWIRNPYELYARKILHLDALDPLGKEPGADLRGSIIHQALARFAKDYPVGSDQLKEPRDYAVALMGIATDILQEFKVHPRIAAFWVPRIERFAEWFGETETDRRAGIKRILAETTGTLGFETDGGRFTLSARADRIDLGPDYLIITDYKTGAIPSKIDVESGRAPQLMLEAAIAQLGQNFALTEDICAVHSLRVIRASGGTPAGEERPYTFSDLKKLAERQLKGLRDLVVKYDDPSTPYRAVRRSGFDYRFDAYSHLARVGEWSGEDGDGGDEA